MPSSTLDSINLFKHMPVQQVKKGHLAVLICILLFRSKVKLFFICLFAVCISFSVNWQFISSACLSLDLLVFFLLMCLISLEIKEISPLSSCCKYLVAACHLSFDFVYVYFCRVEILNFYVVTFINFFLLISRLVACLERPSPFQDYMYLNSPIFSFSTFKVSFFTLKSLIHL